MTLLGPAGKQLAEMVAVVDAPLAGELRSSLQRTISAAQRFPATFERMIAAPAGSAQRRALADEVAAIERQGKLLARAAEALEVTVNFEV